MRTHLVASFLACVLLMPAMATGAEEGALESFERSHETILELVERDTKPADLQREVDALLDYDWLATSALGGPTRYAERCADRCAEFEALLTELIRANYLERLADHEHVTVEYLGEQARETATKVDTRISFKDKSGHTKQLQVDYVMHRNEGRWYVRDIITEDVSLARTYKYEINKLYKAGGIDQVITTLRAKLDELKAK
jgi:phospholipid transport system substrate-binding protein